MFGERRRSAGSMVVFLLTTTPLFAVPQSFDDVVSRCEQAVSDGEVASVSVAVVQDGQLAWADGFGLADREAGIVATADTAYLLASVTKPLLVTGLMTLVDQELIDIDRPANDYLPGAKLRAYRGDASAITVRRLANHTAGLPEHWSFFYGAQEPPPFDITLERYGFAWREPGTAWQYSNLAFGTLDAIVQHVANEPWDEYLQHHVFDPLGMLMTGSSIRREELGSAQYTRDVAGRFERIPPYEFDHSGASALWSSALDLARFARMHLQDGVWGDDQVLSQASTRAMRVRGEGSRNGLAWFVGDRFGRASVSHSGGMPGVSTRIRLFPEDGAAVIVLTNSDGHGLATEVEDMVGRVLFPGVAANASRPESTPDAAPDPASEAGVPGLFVGRLVHHAGDIELMVKSGDEGSVRVQCGGSAERTLDGAVWNQRGLRGSIKGRLAGHEFDRGEARLSFDLRWDGPDALYGVCTSYAPPYAARPHFVELRRDTPLLADERTQYVGERAPAVTFRLPSAWRSANKTTSMRLATYWIGPETETECVVFFFGAGSGGGVRANLDRWIAQFEVEGEPHEEVIDIADGVQADWLDVRGRYIAEVQPGAAERVNQPKSRLLAAIVQCPGGPLFLKLVGPDEEVTAAAPAFRAWVGSIEAAK